MGELRARGVTVQYGRRTVVHDVDLDAPSGRLVALVGPSGSGKSTLLAALVGLVPATGTLGLDGREAPLGSPAAASWRGAGVVLVPQDGAGALDPTRSVGAQIAAAARRGGRPEDPSAYLRRVGLPARLSASSPESLSGGMAQRAALAIVLARGAGVVLVDEPTTGLDPVRAREVVAALRAVANEGVAVVLVTHDLGLVAPRVDAVVVIDGGRVVERAAPGAVGAHPVTRRLLGLGRPPPPPVAAGVPLLEAEGLWRVHRGAAPALAGVDLVVRAGAPLGVVGASGSGKSTLVRCCLGLEPIQRGAICWFGVAGARHPTPRRVQWLPQDPSALLNPGLSLSTLLRETAALHRPGERRDDVVAQALTAVGLEGRGGARPDELSGGERRRAAWARVWAARPQVVIADEPTAALDPPAADALLRLVCQGIGPDGALVLVSHDLPLVASTCAEVVVLDAGRVRERAPTATLLRAPADPATARLLRATSLTPETA